MQKRVGVIRGGTETTAEKYGASLQKGGEIISHIFEHLAKKYKVYDILIDREGVWHINGIPISPADLPHKVDVVWNTASPSISISLVNLSIPYVGNDSFSVSLENSGDLLREHLKQIGVHMPRYITSPQSAKEVHLKFPAPWIVKNHNEVRVVKTFGELDEAIRASEDTTVEEFIMGKLATVHTVPHFRGEEIYTFPLGVTYGVFSDIEKEKLTSVAKQLHQHIGAKHYLKSDFIMTPRGQVYLLQIESTPSLLPNSHLSQVAESVGAKAHNIIEHIIEQAS